MCRVNPLLTETGHRLYRWAALRKQLFPRHYPAYYQSPRTFLPHVTHGASRVHHFYSLDPDAVPTPHLSQQLEVSSPPTGGPRQTTNVTEQAPLHISHPTAVEYGQSQPVTMYDATPIELPQCQTACQYQRNGTPCPTSYLRPQVHESTTHPFIFSCIPSTITPQVP